jgi:hypothetical protein
MKMFLFNLETLMGWVGFHAFSTISLTIVGMKFRDEIIFPTRESSFGFVWVLLGWSGSQLLAQPHDFVLAMILSTDGDGIRLSVILKYVKCLRKGWLKRSKLKNGVVKVGIFRTKCVNQGRKKLFKDGNVVV